VPTAESTPDTQATQQPTAKPTSDAPATYTVKSGDTLSGIASVYGTTWQELAELNNIDDPRRLRVGQELQLP
jgi:LysM repeat protein